MVRPCWSAVVWLGLAGASSTWAAENATESPAKPVAGAFMLECESTQACESASKAVLEKGGRVRQTFKSDIFNGLSVQLANVTTEEDAKALVGQLEGIKGTWQVQKVSLAPEGEPGGQRQDRREEGGNAEEQKGQKPGEQPGNQPGEQPGEQAETEKRRRRLGRRAVDQDMEPWWNHVMTHVDRLHQEGFSGNGIKIAVIDTGVDYTHPALGGCFGPGCRVAFGDNFARDGGDGDPIDLEGHGTMVASIMAGYDKTKGFVGAAPNATIMAYRVLDSQANGDEDGMMAGWIRAYEEGAQIIASSAVFQGWNWAQGPIAMVASRIAASGVPCIVGVGNIREKGLFNAAEPSTGRGVTSVTSFRRSDGPEAFLKHKGTYSAGNKTEPIDFLFGVGQGWKWDGEERWVHDVDADYGDKPDDDLTGASKVTADIYYAINCELSPGSSSSDLAGRVALIRQSPETHGCNFYDRALNAISRGATHVLAWRDDPSEVTVVETRSVQAVGITTSDVGRAMARALASGTQVRVRRTGQLRIVETGYIARESACGPTWDLDIKPNVGAPGQHVPVIAKNGDYGFGSGTSVAAPFVAGVFALVAEARGTFDPVLLNSLIMSTAEPQRAEDGKLMAVAQQGGGMLRAWDAAHATTLVEPASLTFNDTDNRVGSVSLRITNTAETDVTYQLSNLGATTLYTFKAGSITPSEGEAVDAEADIKLSQSSVTIAARQSATVQVSATDPQGLDAKRLPLWSGWIAINGSNRENLTVPYLGLGGSLRSAAVLDPGKRDVRAVAAFGTTSSNFVIGGMGEPEVPLLARHIGAFFDLVLGSPRVHVYLVPLDLCPSIDPGSVQDLSKACIPDSRVIDVSGLKSLGQFPGYPEYFAMRGPMVVRWPGYLRPGQRAPPGRYKIVARALSIMGDAANESDWQTVESTVFSIVNEPNITRHENQLGNNSGPT